MPLIVITKNVTDEDIFIEDLGFLLKALEVENISDFYTTNDIYESLDLKKEVINETIVINNGEINLLPSSAITYLTRTETTISVNISGTITEDFFDDFAWQQTVLDKDLVASPALPVQGDRYIIAGLGGDWATGSIDDIVEWTGSEWKFITPEEGLISWVEDEDKFYVYDGSSWDIIENFLLHNSLGGLQGGTASEYYHLSMSEHTEITTFFDATDITGSEAETLTDGSNADSLHVHTSSSITNFDESVDDRVAALIQDGTGLTWTYNDGADTLTGNVSLSPFSTTDLSEGTNLYYTDTRVDTRVQGQSYAITGSWTFNTALPTSTAIPSGNNDLVTKSYVDNLVVGLDWQDSIIDRDIVTSPGSPTTGDRYIIAGTGGGWSGGTINDIAEYNGSSWDFTTPNEGFAAWAEDEDIIVIYNGVSWVSLGSVSNHNTLSGLQGGTTNEYYHLTSAEHTEITTFFAATNINGSEAEILTDGSNADSLHVHTSSAITDFNEAVDDRVGALLIGGSNITLTYNDPANTLTIDNDITDFTDLGDTPVNYGGTTAGDFVVVNGTTDGLEFSTISIIGGTGTDNRIVRWDGSIDIQDSSFTITDGGQLEAPSGSVGAPSYIFSSDADTGFYRIGPDNIGVAIGASEMLDINSSGIEIGNTGARVNNIRTDVRSVSEDDISLVTEEGIREAIDAAISGLDDEEAKRYALLVC